jgi:hypothetical protein
MTSAAGVTELETIARFWGHAYTFSHDPGTCPCKPYAARRKDGKAPFAPLPRPSCWTPLRTTPPLGPSHRTQHGHARHCTRDAEGSPLCLPNRRLQSRSIPSTS